MPRSLMLAVLAAGCAPYIPASDHECNLIGVCDGDTDTNGTVPVEPGPRDQCNDGVAGATVWNQGTVVFVNDAEFPDLSGTEHMLVFPNDTWSEQGGAACSHDFEIGGNAQRDCDSCDWELTIVLYWLGDSSCNRDQIGVNDQYVYTYRIEPQGGDAVIVYYFDSIERGTGTFDGETLEYLSSPFCTRLDTQ